MVYGGGEGEGVFSSGPSRKRTLQYLYERPRKKNGGGGLSSGTYPHCPNMGLPRDSAGGIQVR